MANIIETSWGALKKGFPWERGEEEINWCVSLGKVLLQRLSFVNFLLSPFHIRFRQSFKTWSRFKYERNPSSLQHICCCLYSCLYLPYLWTYMTIFYLLTTICVMAEKSCIFIKQHVRISVKPRLLLGATKKYLIKCVASDCFDNNYSPRFGKSSNRITYESTVVCQ